MMALFRNEFLFSPSLFSYQQKAPAPIRVRRFLLAWLHSLLQGSQRHARALPAAVNGLAHLLYHR